MFIFWKHFHFSYLMLLESYQIVSDIQNASHFTAHAFQYSMLLGKIHVALLTVLLSDIKVELTNGFPPQLNKSCNFLALLHSVSFVTSFCEVVTCLSKVIYSKSMIIQNG